jgi:DNA-binding transcriptional MocR family regulator
MRHEYTRRRTVLAAVFRDGKAGHLLGYEAGKHVVLQTRWDADAAAVAASQRSVAVGMLTRVLAPTRSPARAS